MNDVNRITKLLNKCRNKLENNKSEFEIDNIINLDTSNAVRLVRRIKEKEINC